MRSQVLSCLAVWGLVWALLSSNEACAQYHWNRTYQNSWAESRCSIWVTTLPGNDTGDSHTVHSTTPPENNLAASATSANWSFSDEYGSGTGSALADGSGELNPDGQATMSWSYIHNLSSQTQTTGEAIVSGGASQSTYVNTTAVLAEDVPTAGTVGRLDVNIGWSGTVFGFKTVNMTVSFGDAWLQIIGGPQNGVLVAQGYDGYGTWVYMESNAPIESATGTLVIGGTDFTSPLQAGDQATIRCNDNVAVDSGREIWGQGDRPTNTNGLFQGVIAIGAGS